MSYIYKLLNYISPVKLLSSVIITEYDISKANINALYESGLIDNVKYNYLSSLPKYDRERIVGKMIEYDTKDIVYKTIYNRIISAKKNLFIKNNLNESEIIRIANDAVYVMRGTNLHYTEFGMMKFIPKNRYTSFLSLGNLYIFFNSSNEDLIVDIIGLGKVEKELHCDYMISFIANILALIESSTIDMVINFYNDFYSSYINMSLPINFYRELNADSMYTIRQTKTNGAYKISNIDQKDIDKIDPSYNMNILRDLYSTIVSIYRPK